MDQSEAEWINAQLDEAGVSELVDGTYDLYLSTDGKHSIRVGGKISEFKGQAAFAQRVFDRLMQRFGSKQATIIKESAKAAQEAGIPEVRCKTCNAPAIEKQGIGKNNKPYHAIFCSTEIKEHTQWMK